MDRKKGQLSLDFYIALIIFLGFLAYLAFQLFQTVPEASENVREESIRIEAYQISELLVNDGGDPNDWYDTVKYPNIADFNRIGLSNSIKDITNYLSRQKIDRLEKICVTDGNYQAVKDKLDVQNEMSITFVEHTLPTDTTWICKSSTLTNKKTAFNVSRTVSVDGTAFAEIIVEVWRI